MFNRPFVNIALIFIAGIILGRHLPLSLWYCLAAISILLSFAYFYRTPRFVIFIFSAVFCLGAFSVKNSTLLPRHHIKNILTERKVFCTLKGFVDSEPQGNQLIKRFVFSIEQAEFKRKGFSCSGKVDTRVKIRKHIDYGDELIIKGYLSGLKDNGYSAYLRGQGIHANFKVDKSFWLVATGKNKGNKIKRAAFYLKGRIKGAIYGYLDPVKGSVLSAMILGEKRDVPRLLYKLMMKTGTVHILVVSGFNVGIVAFAVSLLLKILRVKRKARFYIIFPALFMYCLITGSSTPVLRATIMALVFIFSYLAKREPDIYNSLAFSALLITSFNPLQAFDVGFQLSFASVLAIVYFYPKLSFFFKTRLVKAKPIRFLTDSILVSLSAWLGTFGIIAYNFRMISPVTVLANLFIVPLATLVTLCGVILVGMSLLAPRIAVYVAHTCDLLITLIIYISFLLSSIPYAFISI